MSKEKEDAFNDKFAVLENFQTVLKDESITVEKLKSSALAFSEEYKTLISEAQFLTKVSDKLENKLAKANDQLKMYNQELTTESSQIKNQNEKIAKKNTELFKEKKSLNSKTNNLQFVLVIIMAVMLTAIVFFIYKLYFDDNYMHERCKEYIKIEKPNTEEVKTSTDVKP